MCHDPISSKAISSLETIIPRIGSAASFLAEFTDCISLIVGVSMKLLFALLLLCCHFHLAFNMSIPSAQPKIAIIGGGAAGLACARIYSRAGLKPVVFEKDAVVGGIWQRVPGSRDRPMYKGLRTNLPKEIMAFREFPFPTTVNASFVTHQVVFDYLQSYAKHFELEQYIQTNCCVKQITVLSDQSAEGLVNESWKKIRIRWSDATCKDCATEDFDAVCVANGHYARPIIPLIDGIQHFTGSVMHSIEYDEPQIYADQRVLCVGGRASGSDLAREVAQYAKYVYLSDTTAPSKPLTKYNVTWVPKTTHVLEDGRTCFHDCDEPVHFDTIIFCTGYDYEFPFVNDHSNLEIDAESRRVSPLYEQLWHAGSPNVAFLGLPHSVLPFPLFELQAEALLQQWVTKWTLPDATTLMTLAKSAASSGGEGKSNGRVPEDTHFLGDAQWDYCRRMAKYAGLYTDKMEDYLMTNQTIYKDAAAARSGEFPAGPDNYRSRCYNRDNGRRTFQLRILNENTPQRAVVHR